MLAQHRKYFSDITSVSDYYPFGSPLYGRRWSAGYRLGFNGKENDNEVMGNGNFQDYGARMYDTRLGRFISADPIIINEHKYTFYSPYQFAGNKPIVAIDLDGLEELPYFDLGGLYRKGKSYIEKKTYQYIAKQVTETISTAYNSLDDKSKSKVWQGILMYEFITGTGPERREFGSDHPLTKDVASSNMTTIALNKMYEEFTKNNKNNNIKVDVTFINHTRWGDTGPLREYLADKEFTAAQFLGSAKYMFDIDFKNQIINIIVEDTKTEESFLYYLPGTDRHTRKENPIMGKTFQTYEFTISFSEFEKRTGHTLKSNSKDNNKGRKNKEKSMPRIN